MKYFKDDVYGISLETDDEIIPFDTLIENTGSTFLDAFINEVDIKKAFVICRYKKWNEEIDNYIHYKEMIDGVWIKKNRISKLEAYETLMKYKDYNTHVKCDTYFSDDVLILAKKGDTYWFFWFDRDCSDSCIARFKTDDSENEVIKEFTRYVKEVNDENSQNYQNQIEHEKEIPVDYFKGWISS